MARVPLIKMTLYRKVFFVFITARAVSAFTFRPGKISFMSLWYFNSYSDACDIKRLPNRRKALCVPKQWFASFLFMTATKSATGRRERKKRKNLVSIYDVRNIQSKCLRRDGCKLRYDWKKSAVADDLDGRWPGLMERTHRRVEIWINKQRAFYGLWKWNGNQLNLLNHSWQWDGNDWIRRPKAAPCDDMCCGLWAVGGGANNNMWVVNSIMYHVGY